MAFLPSRLDERVPVPNRYFGVFQDGTFKLRGIEARRGDTPAFIVETQLQMLELLARAERLPECLPSVLALLRRRVGELRRRKIPLEKLLVSQKLSRNLEEYRTPSPAARAVAQLQATGKSVRRGQHVRFLYTRGEPHTHSAARAGNRCARLGLAGSCLAGSCRFCLRRYGTLYHPAVKGCQHDLAAYGSR